PDIDNNIKCGNSLIGTDFFAQQNFNLSENEQLKINCFDWEKEFVDVFKKNRGFDIVIGNPPYVRNRILDRVQKDYFARKYKSVKGQFDLYQLFYENGIKIICDGGLIGFITSNKFAITDYGKELRNIILETCKIKQIIDVSNIEVFKQASIYLYIFILKKSQNNSNNQIKYAKIQHFEELQNIRLKKISQTEYKHSINNSFILRVFPAFFKRINSQSIKLGEIASIKETIHTGNIRDKLVTNKKSSTACKKLLFGKDVHRYKIEWKGNYIRYDKKLIDKTKGEYANLCNEIYFEKQKILLREIAYNIEAVFDEDHFYTLNKLYSIQLFDNILYDYLFLLGLLNSKFMSYYFRESFEEAHLRGGYLQFKKIYTSQIPIIKLDLNIPTDKIVHDNIVSLVEKMLQLKLKEHTEQKPQMKTMLQRQINGLDQQIDKAVYQLYGLTEEEIRIIEGE
ncbi:MAG: Eco57I restriction-modification methylase domain-containing protein, partial [Planctomycetaceae bacterium]|nr:Eco57I restriction-modification methylase domain-containing protein [Planctomycetaceae bacterium]